MGVFTLITAEAIGSMAVIEITYVRGVSFAVVSHSPVACTFDVANSMVVGRRMGDRMPIRSFVMLWSDTFSRRNLIKTQDCGSGVLARFFGTACSISRRRQSDTRFRFS